jgi:hypothetical protein
MTVAKTTALAIMNELEGEINRVLEKHGLDKAKLKCKYGAHFELKIESATLELGENGVNLQSPEAQYYTQFGYMGLHAPLGTKFTNRGATFVFIGIAPSRRKYPIAVRNLDEGHNSFFPEGIIRVINAAASVAV